MHETPKAKEGDEFQPPGTRPLRFVPHESASDGGPPSVEAQEKSLTAKFRSAALASLATTSGAHEAPGDKVGTETEAIVTNASAEQATATGNENATPAAA